LAAFNKCATFNFYRDGYLAAWQVWSSSWNGMLATWVFGIYWDGGQGFFNPVFPPHGFFGWASRLAEKK